MVLLQNYIYFGNSSSSSIYIYNKTSLNQISWYRLKSRGGVTDMAMFASDVQPAVTSKLMVCASVVRYPRYLGKYRDTTCDDTSIAKVTVNRGPTIP